MRVVLFALASASVAVLLGGCPSRSTTEGPACRREQAFSATPVFGASAPAKHIALSFDDGPASRTSELSTYLKREGIRATFFVNANAQQAHYMGVLPQVVADGHVLANHTKDHLDLTKQDAATVVAEVTQLDTVIAPYVPANRFLFRAPYGAWDTNAYNALQASPMKKYLGPIGWETGDKLDPAKNEAADWACWQKQPALSARQCGDLYVKEIEATDHGIVLAHDADYGNSSTNDLDVVPGNTVIMMKYIVPILKAKGFTFIGVDEIPDIAAALPPLPADTDDGGDAGAIKNESTTLDAATPGPDAGTVGPTSNAASSSGGASASGLAPAPPPAAVTAGPCP